MGRPKAASAAQARKLAWMFWSNGHVTTSENYTDPTIAAMIKAGWLTKSYEGTGANGSPIKQFSINSDGLGALERYLWNLRVNSTALPQTEGKHP